MKKIKYLLIALFLMLVVDVTSVSAVKVSSDELGPYLDEYNGASSSSAYVIGEYLFTDAIAIGTDDIMYAARTIEVNVTDGTRNDASFKKMQIMEMYYEGEWKFKEYFSGKDPITEYNICYIDYVYICDEDTKYTVTFKNGDTVLATENLIVGTQVKMFTDELEEGITKDNYTFVGWKNETTGEVVDETTVITGDATYVMVWEAITTAQVSNETELLLALGNSQYTTIELTNDIDVSASVVVGRDVTIDGKGYSIARTGTPAYVPGGNNYVLKVYGASEVIDVELNDVKLTNSMAAVLVGNDANVTMDKVDLDGNVWGGIEVKDTATTTLTVKVENLTYTEEAYGKPVAWVDNEVVENATIAFTLDSSSWEVTETSVKNQVHYYLDAANANGVVVTSEEELLSALTTTDVVSLSNDIELTSPLNLSNDITINGNGNKILANNINSSSLITITADVTMNEVVVDANNEARAIKVSDGDLTLVDSIVQNGNASSYASGIFVTEEGNVIIENSTITGNTAGESEPNEYYAKYSSDLWIGSEATGTITSGTIGNVFVNDNIYGNGGILTVNDGTVDAVYLEYEDGAYATLNYVGGTIGELSIASAPGLGFSAPNPVYGTYKSGEENKETIVASVSTEDALVEALNNAWYDEIELTSDVELTNAITLNRNVVIKGNGNELKANDASGSTLVTISEYSNVTLENVVVNGNNELRAIKVTDASLTLKNSTVTGGNASSYASGIFVTEEGNITIENSTVTGNTAGESLPNVYYAKYSSDLWIGSEATGTITSGTIGNVFVNENQYGNGGTLTVQAGTIENVYLEYDDGVYATLVLNGGTVNNLYKSTTTGNGDYTLVLTPAVGTYKSGE